MTVAKQSPAKSVYYASVLTKLPDTTTEEVDNTLWEEAAHDSQIGEGEIHYEHVGRGAEGSVLHENVEDKHVTKNGDAAWRKQKQ